MGLSRCRDMDGGGFVVLFCGVMEELRWDEVGTYGGPGCPDVRVPITEVTRITARRGGGLTWAEQL